MSQCYIPCKGLPSPAYPNAWCKLRHLLSHLCGPLDQTQQGGDHHLKLHSFPARQSEHEAFELCAQCGKLALLDRLLTRLHKDGHKVLIFSQVCSWGPSHTVS